MLLHSPLAVVTASVDGDVLAALAGADDWFTLTRLMHLIPGRSREGIRKAVLRLIEQGIVDSMDAGNAGMYRLNREHLAARAIMELASVPSRFFDQLRQALEQWDPQPMFAAVFGSAARGGMTTTSDIDIFLVHPFADASTWDEPLDDLTRRASRWVGNDIRPLVMTAKELAGAADQEPVLADVFESGVPLLGSLASLRQLSGALQ